MFTYLKAETIKIRRTSVIALAVILPLVTIALSFMLARNYLVYDNYNWWYLMMNPFLITVTAGLIWNKDSKLRHRAVKLLPVNQKKVWNAKVILGSTVVMLASILICIGTVLLQELLKNQEGVSFLAIPVIQLFIGSILIGLLSAWQIPFCFLVLQKCGFFLTILINVGLNLILSVTVSTSSIWFAFPHSYLARLMIPVLHILPNGLPAVEESMGYSVSLMDSSAIFTGTVIGIVLLVLLTGIGGHVYARSEAQ